MRERLACAMMQKYLARNSKQNYHSSSHENGDFRKTRRAPRDRVVKHGERGRARGRGAQYEYVQVQDSAMVETFAMVTCSRASSRVPQVPPGSRRSIPSRPASTESFLPKMSSLSALSRQMTSCPWPPLETELHHAAARALGASQGLGHPRAGPIQWHSFRYLKITPSIAASVLARGEVIATELPGARPNELLCRTGPGKNFLEFCYS